jgi:hypothetical protein
LLRQQQLQRQQEQSSHHEQQHRSTAGFTVVQANQQGRGRSASERQRQDEQGFSFFKQTFKHNYLFRLSYSSTSNR